MKGSRAHRERMVWGFLLSAAVACLASGAARATCNPTLPITAGSVPCYIKVQPIDVGVTALGTTVFAPFNTTAETGDPNSAGMPPQSISVPKGSNIPKSIPDNPTSPNPIGFVVDPKTGLSPGESGYTLGTGVDVTRVLLNDIGVELVWFPMLQYAYPTCPSSDSLCTVATQDFTTLTVGLTSTGTTVATGCTGSISGTTLTITSACGTGALGIYDILSGTGIATSPAPGTFISAYGTGSGGAGTYTVNISQNVGSTPISATSTTLSSPLFLTLADQNPSPNTPPSVPCAISQMTIPVSSQCGSPSPSPPLSKDPGTINLFFVNKLNPPASGGTLYGFSLLGNNGVAIGGNTFFAPSPLQARPDTIAHELLHDLGIDHVSYGAGPYNPWNMTTNPNGGILPPLPGTPTNGECDPTYPACAANLMTTGVLRTEPAIFINTVTTEVINCVLNGYMGDTTPGCTTTMASLYNGLADQVAVAVTTGSSLLPSFATVISGAKPASTTQLPTSQQDEVLNGGSGLLVTQPSTPLHFSGLADPIPYETTKAQLDTGGSATGRAIFDLSGPVDGKPGETLVAWVLTLPQEQTFAGHDGFHILSQSRADLVQDVDYYPDREKHRLMRNIAYNPGADNDQDNPSIEMAGSSPCTSATAECLVVKFQPPGLGTQDTISFSEHILKAGAPITQDELCKAKITYLFSDGFMTTSNFGRCPAVPLPLIASSWHPDPYVAPHVIKSDLLLAKGGSSLPCTPVSVPNPSPPPATILVCPGATYADIDYAQEGGQLTAGSCDNGVTISNPNISGIVSGPIGNTQVSLSAGQICNYLTGSEILGSMIINGAQVYLNGLLNGNLTVNYGRIVLGESAHVVGNVQISQGAGNNFASGFIIGNSQNQAQIDGNLTIQNIPNKPIPENGGVICNTRVGGSVTVLNNLTPGPISIGETSSQQNCPGNTIGGSLTCTGNMPPPASGQNTASHFIGQCNG